MRKIIICLIGFSSGFFLLIAYSELFFLNMKTYKYATLSLLVVYVMLQFVVSISLFNNLANQEADALHYFLPSLWAGNIVGMRLLVIHDEKALLIVFARNSLGMLAGAIIGIVLATHLATY